MKYTCTRFNKRRKLSRDFSKQKSVLDKPSKEKMKRMKEKDWRKKALPKC